MIESVIDMLPKLAAAISVDEKVRSHFGSEKPDWKAFEKNLRSKTFRDAIAKAEQSDPTLKRYVKNFGGYQASKDVIAEVKSKDSGRMYRVKDLHTGRWGCNCGDWQYHHSVKGGDCKHIKSVKQSKLVKTANPLGLGANIALRTDNARRRGKQAKQTVQGIRKAYGMPQKPTIREELRNTFRA